MEVPPGGDSDEQDAELQQLLAEGNTAAAENRKRMIAIERRANELSVDEKQAILRAFYPRKAFVQRLGEAFGEDSDITESAASICGVDPGHDLSEYTADGDLRRVTDWIDGYGYLFEDVPAVAPDE